jgi:hypothetical protein
MVAPLDGTKPETGMSQEESKTPSAPDDEVGSGAADDEVAPAGEAVSAAGDEPIEAEFEPADSLWTRVTERQVSMPIALGLAVAASLVGGFLGVVLDGGGARVSPAQIEAAVDRRLAPFEALRTELRQAIADGTGDGIATAALNDLEAELASVRDQLAAVESRLRVAESASGNGQANAALAAQLEALETELAQARALAEEALAAPAAQTAELDSLETRVNALGETARAQGRAIEQLSQASSVLAGRVTGVAAPQGFAAAGAAAALKFASLQEAALAGRPFVTEAAEAQEFFGESEDLTALMAFAETGAPTPTVLVASFRSATRAAREAEAPAGGGFVDRLGRAVAGLVTVRRLDAPPTDSVGDVIVRAQRRIQDNDLAGAAAELERLEGAPGAAVAFWVGQARARIEIDARLDALRQSFSER